MLIPNNRNSRNSKLGYNYILYYSLLCILNPIINPMLIPNYIVSPCSPKLPMSPVTGVTAGSMFRRCQSSGASVRQSCDAAAAVTRLTRRDGTGWSERSEKVRPQKGKKNKRKHDRLEFYKLKIVSRVDLTYISYIYILYKYKLKI